jgi:hypothetical protein
LVCPSPLSASQSAIHGSILVAAAGILNYAMGMKGRGNPLIKRVPATGDIKARSTETRTEEFATELEPALSDFRPHTYRQL